jgi:YidC/Oxa1 family membrane protein insertase
LLPLANIIQDAFSPLIDAFAAILVFIHDHIVASWGLSIIGLTVLVRLVLLPLTMKQFQSMQKMQLLAPQLNEIKEKYKEDKQRQQEEMMKFYKEQGVNPFASCLPLVLQLPVLISLFYALRQNLKTDICGPGMALHFTKVTGHLTTVHTLTSAQIQSVSCNQVAPGSAKFLFIPDLTAAATGGVLIVLLALYIGTQLASTVLMSASADPNQRRLMLILPLVFTLFIFRFPAGVLVYWITTNIWTLGQQYFVRRTMGVPPAPAAATANGSAKTGGLLGSLLPGRTAAPPAELAAVGGPAPAAGEASKPAAPAKPAPAAKGLSGGGSAAPPPPPRRKKKRSGRRR